MTAAFFDLDETLISTKSMFMFLDFYLRQTRRPQAPTYENVMQAIHAKVKEGASRIDINHYYYSLFEGERQAYVRQLADECFARSPIQWQHDVVARLKRHLHKGDRVVIVSGAMRDIIDPIAKQLGVIEFLCSELGIRDGFYTGTLMQQAIGVGKADLLQRYCTSHDVDPAQCWAYGDHLSDRHMLSCVGHAVAVYPHADLMALARARRWEVIN